MGRLLPEFSVNLHVYTALQGGLVLWYTLSPLSALFFVASVPSSYLAGVIACLTDECLAPVFRRYPARQQSITSKHRQAPALCG